MAEMGTLFQKMQDTYELARKQECETLHNAMAKVLAEQKATIQNALFVLELLKLELLWAKYQEVMGNVKLSDKPPVPTMPSGKAAPAGASEKPGK